MAQYNQIGTHKTHVWMVQNWVYVRYNSTKIVSFAEHRITLDTGGYRTRTTMLRMNQVSTRFKLGYHIYQKRHKWFVNFKGKTRPLVLNTIHLNR